MNTLETRKQLLLLESELNREQLAREMAEVRTCIRMLTGRAEAFTAIVSSTAVLVSALASFRRRKPADEGVKSSWLQTILKGAGLASTLWAAFRARRRDHQDK
jgi:hypothetical protein